MRTTTRKRMYLLPAFLAVLVGVGACSGGGDDSSTDTVEASGDDDVATLGAGDDDGNDDAADDEDDDSDAGGGQGGLGGDGPSPEFQDAMLEYAQCMRDEGIDMPDPTFTEDGGVMIGAGAAVQGGGGPGGAARPTEGDMAEMEAANEACGHIMEEARESMPEPDPEQMAEMQDQALEFAQCMRDHGIDMPDPQFSEGGGQVTMSLGEPGGGGIDPMDEDFQEASEACGGEGGFRISSAAGVAGGGSDDE